MGIAYQQNGTCLHLTRLNSVLPVDVRIGGLNL